ncbi:MAG: secretin N-terminal domain-containing protein, partial [Planctomycetaceae bacterium]
MLRLDQNDARERINKVYRLKNAPALDVAQAINEFLRNERLVQQAGPGQTNQSQQIETEVVVVPEPVGNSLIISATERYFEEISELVN